MPLLDPTPTPTLTPAQAVAASLVRLPRQQFEIEFLNWKRGMLALWQNPAVPVSDILAEIGTDAAELFQLSAAKVRFFEEVKPGCTTDVLALMQPFTVNPDGTVTLD